MSNSAEPVAAEPKTAAAIAAKAVASSPQEKAAQHKSTDDNAVVKGGPEPADGKRRGKRRGNAKKNVEKDQQGEGGKQNKGDRQQRKRRDDWFKIDFDALDVEGVTLAELEAAVDKLKKNEVKKPDFSALKERTDKLQSKIESYKAQLAKLRERWSKKLESSREARSKRGEILEGAKSITQKIDAKHEERKKLEETLERLQAEMNTLHTQRSEILRDLGGLKTEKDIDAAIKRIEEEIETTSSDAKEEKQNITRIKRLKQLKPQIQEQERLAGSIGTLRERINALREKIKEKKGEIKELVTERRSYFEKADASKVQNEKGQEERDNIRKRENELRDKIKQTYNEIVAENKKFYERREKFKQYLIDLKTAEAKVRKKGAIERRLANEARRKKMQEERERRAAEKKKEEERIAQEWREYEEFVKQNPYETEIAMSEALLVFLKNLKSKSGKRRNRNKFSLPLDKYQAFDRLGLSAPLTFDALDDAIDGVQKKIDYFNSFKAKPSDKKSTDAATEASKDEVKADSASPSESVESEEQNTE